jgi:hypothetical protein
VKKNTINLRASRGFAEPIQKLLILRTQDFWNGDSHQGLRKWIISVDTGGSSNSPPENPSNPENHFVDPESSVNSESSDTSLPPPSPCIVNSDIFAGLPPPTPHTSKLSVLKCKFHAEDFENPPRLQSKPVLFRSESTACITKCDQREKWNHRNVFYENIFQYDDSTYTYRVYINEPSFRPYHPRMKVRIDRWNRLSDALEEVNHETVRRHGLWFDNQYRNRSSDDSYKK